MTDFITPVSPPMPLPGAVPTSAKPLALLPLIAENLDSWQIHRCQVTDASLTQHRPMKLIYHYEALDEDTKAHHPLTGRLLTQFDQVMTREQFAEQLGISLITVAEPWQLKFSGKLVVFNSQPEIAIRLHWTNTLKAFEPVYCKELDAAIEQSFVHWQWVDSVEVVNKTPQLYLTADLPDERHWQLAASLQFERLPGELTAAIHRYLLTQACVQEDWLSAIKDSAQTYAQAYQLADGQ